MPYPCPLPTTNPQPPITRLLPLPPFAFHERQSVAGQLVFALEHAAPDLRGGGQGGQREAEGFNHEPSVVARLFERVEAFLPMHVSLARRAAVVFRDMDV